jgi:hypothetical protein
VKDLYLGHAARGGRDARKIEGAELVVVAGPRPLALMMMLIVMIRVLTMMVMMVMMTSKMEMVTAGWLCVKGREFKSHLRYVFPEIHHTHARIHTVFNQCNGKLSSLWPLLSFRYTHIQTHAHTHLSAKVEKVCKKS